MRSSIKPIIIILQRKEKENILKSNISILLEQDTIPTVCPEALFITLDSLRLYFVGFVCESKVSLSTIR